MIWTPEMCPLCGIESGRTQVTKGERDKKVYINNMIKERYQQSTGRDGSGLVCSDADVGKLPENQRGRKGAWDKEVWKYEDSNESNWSNHARECYPIAVSIPELIYLVPLKHQGLFRNIKVSLETSRFLLKHHGFSQNIKVSLKTNYIDSIPIYI